MTIEQKLKRAGFTLLHRDTMGFDQVRHNESGEVLYVWYCATKIGDMTTAPGQQVDFDRLGIEIQKELSL